MPQERNQSSVESVATGGGALDAILRPRTVAVIGASRSSGSIGHEILHNILRFGYTGCVYPVNPQAKAVHSLRAFPSIAAIGEPVDLAVIVVPKQAVVGVAEECGRAGVRGLVVISAGFREMGPAGAELERALVEVVRRYGMRMVGPNCMGVLNTEPATSLNATFASAMPPYGPAAVVSQSGAVGANVLDYARELGIGVSQFVSMGNKPDVSGNDLLLQWEHDPSVGVILMYVESFGNPRRFLEIAGRVTRRKPIIVVKSGRSLVGAKAAASHTGALTTSDATVDALLAQAGVLRAGTIEELFDLAVAFTARQPPRSRRTAVLTNSGGPGILAADALERHGMELPSLAADTVDRIRPLCSEEASIRNPLDMIASATPAQYGAALEALLADPGVDSAIAMFTPLLGARQEDVAEAIGKAAARHAVKPVLAVLMGRDGLPEGRTELQHAGIPAYVFPESAARGLAALRQHREWRERGSAPAVPRPLVVDREAAARILDGARRAGRVRLNELEALQLLAAYGLPTPPTKLARTADEAAAAAAEIGYPVVIKVSSPEVVHKTDVGGVRLGITSAVELREACAEMLDSVTRQAPPPARLAAILVQHQVEGGREMIAGISREPALGPLVMFGLGGIYVEILGDVVFRLAPLTSLDAHDMLRGIRGARILDGVRGAPPADVAALADALLRLSQLAIDHEEIVELDVNPLLALPQGSMALDARVQLAPPAPG